MNRKERGGIMANKKCIFTLFLAFITLVFAVANTSATTWTIEMVDDTNYYYLSSRAIAIDAGGHPHIVYGSRGSNLYHAYHDGTSWYYETVDSRAGGYASVVLDKSDKMHISYGNVGSGTTIGGPLKYATNASGSWEITTVDSSFSGGYTSIALDTSGKMHISYGNSAVLKYATNTSGSWEITTVDSFPGEYSSIAIDTSGKAHISYGILGRTDAALKYATNISGSWEITTVDGGGEYTSIALDTFGKVHISYGILGGPKAALKYATNTSGSWEITTVDSVLSGYTSIVLDTSGKVHISYGISGTTMDALKYATNISDSWEITTVDSNLGGYTSIALDASDKVHISYGTAIGYDTSILKYAANSPQSTECLPVSITAYPNNLKIKKKESDGVIVGIRGEDDCPTKGITVHVKINKADQKRVSVSPEEGATTDANGEAIFTFTGKKKGKAKATFTVNSLEYKEKITILVK